MNELRRVNGDPSKPVTLTAQGEAQSLQLRAQLANVAIDACVHTRFERTRRTAELVLDPREIPMREEPLLDDLDLGALEGATLEQYRKVKHSLLPHEPFPGGESRHDAARRYARALRRLVGCEGTRVLVIAHEIPLRYALNGALNSSSLDGPVHEIPNAAPYVFDAAALLRAAATIESLTATRR